ncbi:hypothetical protein TGGT1_411680 [Toxoplasma gondii GT1]|uniref:Uncharacterized protein n=1 Tax=Toxoplasma gondii (strain ATCC 50853 / GT1) TaxID=507601 RepID=S7UFY4_TOXGG|nr:hypothetical protein TGGT1_411680 [Toxoplasma gondii GT1]
MVAAHTHAIATVQNPIRSQSPRPPYRSPVVTSSGPERPATVHLTALPVASAHTSPTVSNKRQDRRRQLQTRGMLPSHSGRENNKVLLRNRCEHTRVRRQSGRADCRG